MEAKNQELIPVQSNLDKPKTEAQVLQYLFQARSALEKVRTIQDAVSVKGIARAIEELAKQIEVAEEIQHDATELRIRAERTLGLAMQEMPKNKGSQGAAKGKDSSGGSIVDPPEDATPTLKELGIVKAEADRCRKLARLPEEHFEAIVAGKGFLHFTRVSTFVVSQPPTIGQLYSRSQIQETPLPSSIDYKRKGAEPGIPATLDTPPRGDRAHPSHHPHSCELSPHPSQLRQRSRTSSASRFIASFIASTGIPSSGIKASNVGRSGSASHSAISAIDSGSIQRASTSSGADGR